MRTRKVIAAGLGSAMALVVAPALTTGSAASATPMSGAIFTTVLPCEGAVNRNVYDAREDVYINGGPARPGAAGLPAGEYYVRVTEPSVQDPVGGVLGTSIGTTTPRPVVVKEGGDFASCYKLYDLLNATKGGIGYDFTGNPGGVYKVWVCQDAEFTESQCKTDNFKVKDPSQPVEKPGVVAVEKYYDANANGLPDDGSFNNIEGWKVRIQNGIDLTRYTPASVTVAPGPYTVSESMPVESNWMTTTAPTRDVSVASGGTTTVQFGNLCLGEGGGLTLGFWSNKNGQTVFNSKSTNLTAMQTLNLRDASGAHFDPTGYASFRTWLLGADAVNMANMLSAQLAATQLNVLNGRVAGESLVHAPGVVGANALGFITVKSLITEADKQLGLNGHTPSGNANRAYQQVLKDALDNANNNKTFVQKAPCVFTFAP